jgi:MFS family permease
MMDDPSSARATDGPGRDDQGWTPRWVLSLVSLLMAVEALSIGYSMISIGLPQIISHFNTDQGGWLLTSYLLAGTVAAALLGKLADLHGKRRVLLLTLLVSGIGAMICAVAPTFEIMILGRAIQGVVVATLFLGYSLIRDVYPRRIIPFAASVSTTGVGAISIVIPIVVGWLLFNFGFRGMFWFDVVWTFTCALLIWATTPESPLRRQARVDFLGAALLGGGVASLLMLVSMGRNWGWASATPWLFGAAGVVLLIGYGFHARRASDPIVNLRLFRRKPLMLAAVVAAISAIGAITQAVLPLLAMTPREVGGTYGLGMTPLEFAWIETPRGLASVLAGMVVGVVVTRYGRTRHAVIVGMALWAVGTLYLAFRNDTFADVEIAVLIVGMAHGTLFAVVPNLVIAATPPGDQGSTAGAVQVSQAGFGSTLPVILFAIMAPHAVSRPGAGVVYLETGIQYGLFLVAGIALTGIILTLTVFRTTPDIRRGKATSAEPVAERSDAP